MSPLVLNEPDIIADRGQDDTVLINLRNGRYFRLDGRASQALDLLLESTSICRVGAFSAESLKAFAELLVEKNLLRGDVGLLQFESSEGTLSEGPPIELEEFGDLEDLLGLDPIHDVSPTEGWPVRDRLG